MRGLLAYDTPALKRPDPSPFLPTSYPRYAFNFNLADVNVGPSQEAGRLIQETEKSTRSRLTVSKYGRWLRVATKAMTDGRLARKIFRIRKWPFSALPSLPVKSLDYRCVYYALYTCCSLSTIVCFNADRFGQMARPEWSSMLPGSDSAGCLQ